jgi:peptidoglycan/xylan/chitin deacetylase (PgdA/CDA1 family)
MPEKVIPDEKLISTFSDVDKNKEMLLMNQEEYTKLISWVRETPIISRGRFTDQMRSVDEDDFSDILYFQFDTENYEDVSWISLYFSTDVNNKNYFYYDITPYITRNEKDVVINFSDFLKGEGNPSWEKVRYFRIAFQAKDGKTFSITPKSLATYKSTKPVITLWFDDGWEDNYFNAFRITSRVDPSIKGTIGLIGSRIGQDRYLKNNQILELKDSGWEFVNHSYTHPDLTTLSDEKVLEEVEKNFNIVSKYDPVGAYHFVVPYSSVDERVLNIIKDSSLSARYVPESYDQFPISRYSLSFFEVTNETDFDTIKQNISEAINKNQWIGLLFHRIEDPANDRYSYSTHQFEQLIYYLSHIKNDIEIMTPSQVFEFYGLPIEVSTTD